MPRSPEDLTSPELLAADRLFDELMAELLPAPGAGQVVALDPHRRPVRPAEATPAPTASASA